MQLPALPDLPAWDAAFASAAAHRLAPPAPPQRPRQLQPVPTPPPLQLQTYRPRSSLTSAPAPPLASGHLDVAALKGTRMSTHTNPGGGASSAADAGAATFGGSFVTAKSIYSANEASPNRQGSPSEDAGVDPRPIKPFKAPFKTEPPPQSSTASSSSSSNNASTAKRPPSGFGSGSAPKSFAAAAATAAGGSGGGEVHPRLKGIDPDLVERIENEILEMGQKVTFDDISGLEFAKECIEELVVWPVLNPQLYSGLRQLPKGLLLFGPPGTGKTLIGKAIAHECNATFFSVSASSLTSKWIGEGEKTVRALFAVAAARQPSVIFIDEIDSLLTQRSSDENEASRRIKTEFLVQFDGAATTAEDVVLVIGATNRPQELDEAARRRFVRRLYIPLPERESRIALLEHLLLKNPSVVTPEELEELGDLTEGYSGADVTNLAREAAMGPLRDVMRPSGGAVGEKKRSRVISTDSLRPINRQDFTVALKSVKPSVSNVDLGLYTDWNAQFGTQKLE